jgi:adenylate kinase family enzyme
MKLLLVYGLPGTGKTTFGKLLPSHHISCGDLVKKYEANYVESYINNELCDIEEKKVFLSIDGLKLHNSNNINILRNLNDEYPIDTIIFIENIEEEYIYIKKENVKKFKNLSKSLFNNINTIFLDDLKDRLLLRNREDDKEDVINVRLQKNKDIHKKTMLNLIEMNKYLKFNYLILNYQNTNEINNEIIKKKI